MKPRHFLFLILLVAPLAAYAAQDQKNPEPSGKPPASSSARSVVKATGGMVVAANPLAVKAGHHILELGGSAVDAAIAVQLVLNIVEPQSSGIGGGGFMLVYDAKTKTLRAYDGREAAPESATDMLFLNEFGEMLNFDEAAQSSLSVGVPGLVRLLGLAHHHHGKLKWATLFDDAIAVAKDGFPLSPRLQSMLETSTRPQYFAASFRPFLNDKGVVKNEGEIIKNPELAATLELLAAKGSDEFYTGKIAESIVSAVQASPKYQGGMDLEDLKSYHALEREPLCGTYRDYKICSMPPPSSGGVAILQALKIIEFLPVSIASLKPVSADAAHLFAETSKLAYADRNRYIGDPDYVDVPTKALLNDDYLKLRAVLVNPKKSTSASVEAGDPHMPPAAEPKEDGVAPQPEPPSTTHISVVDAEGNAVAFTSSIEQGFGSGLSASGFLLNNQLTDFSFMPNLDDEFFTPHPNRVQPGKRPRSSMSPTMVFDKNGDLLLVVGSPGGGRIIDYVLQTILAVLDWKLDIQHAVSLPHYVNMNLGVTELEAGTEAAKLKASLEARGHHVIIGETGSGLHGIAITPDGLEGGADPRREGIAMGMDAATPAAVPAATSAPLEMGPFVKGDVEATTAPAEMGPFLPNKPETSDEAR